MICKNCNAENPEESVFCGSCGKRLDGNVVCPRCGNLVPEQNNFCNTCGAKLKNIPAPRFEQEAQPMPAQTPYAYPAREKASAGDWKRILEIVAGALSMAGVFFALLFTFLIGVKTGTGDSFGSNGYNAPNGTVGIYYYFVKVYRDIGAALNSLESYSGFYEGNTYFIAVAGTVICAGIIIGVVTLSVISLVRYLRKILNKSQKDYAPTAIAAMVVYLFGASLFLGLNAIAVSIRSGFEQVVSIVSYTPATLAGIALCSLFLVGFVGCRVARYGKQLGTKPYLFRIIFSAVAAILCIVVWQNGAGIVFKLGEREGLQSSSAIRLSPYCALQLLTAKYLPVNSQVDYSLYVSVLLSLFAQIALIALCAALTIQSLNTLAGEKYSSCMGLGIAAATLALLLLITSCLSCFYCMSAYGSENEFATAVPAIVAFVFAMLVFGVTVAHFVLKRKCDKANKTRERSEQSEQQVAE